MSFHGGAIGAKGHDRQAAGRVRKADSACWPTQASTVVKKLPIFIFISSAVRVPGIDAPPQPLNGDNIMGSFSIWHWLIVLVIIALIFGTKKLRNMGEDLGSAVKGFKKGMRDVGDEVNKEGIAEQQRVQSGDTIDVDAKEKPKA